MNYRNQICVPPLPSECRQTCLLCIDLSILSLTDLVWWGTQCSLITVGSKQKKSLKAQTHAQHYVHQAGESGHCLVHS